MTEYRWDICANYKQLATLARKLGLSYSTLDKWMRETNLGYSMSERTLGLQTSHRIDSQLVCDARWIMPWLVRVTQRVLWCILNKDHSTLVVILEHYYWRMSVLKACLAALRSTLLMLG